MSRNRFQPDDARWPDHWVRFPMHCRNSPEQSLLPGDALDLVRRELPEQRIVVSPRGVAGYDSEEVCARLDLTPANQPRPAHC